MIDLLSVETEADRDELRGYIIQHFEKTNSRIAKKILDNWMEVESQFVKVFPKDYQRVLAKQRSENSDEDLSIRRKL